MKSIRNIIKAWLPFALGITVLAGLVYTSVQQVYRMGANDPQIQMAEDAASALAAGQPAGALVPAGKIDIARSLAPYWVVFDANGKVLASDAVLNGETPILPTGVMEYTRQHGEDRISYQPQPGVRSAVVVAAANGGQAGFVMVGRSLREVEDRINNLALITGGLWAAAMAISLGLAAVMEFLHW
jgi:hypothetical protein